MAAGCEAVVESNDAMQFNVKSIDVPKSCKKFSVTLKHVGKMPKTAMGHNIVVSTSADMQPCDRRHGRRCWCRLCEGRRCTRAGSTKLIGGGETTKSTSMRASSRPVRTTPSSAPSPVTRPHEGHAQAGLLILELTQELAALSSKFQLYKHLKSFMTSAISFQTDSKPC
jgi:azurin